MRTFEELIAEAEAVSVDGWDFSWLSGRATEERPSWGYQRLLAERLGRASAALDIQTGGGEVLAGAARLAAAKLVTGQPITGQPIAGQPVAGQSAPGMPAHGAPAPAQRGALPATMAATESWPPNVARATGLLHPLGVVVVADPDEPPLPFGDGAFDLVTSRHPVKAWWSEIARVLRPGGTYCAQHVGPASGFELVEYFLGPQPEARRARRPEDESAAARDAGLEVEDLRSERLRMEFLDIGAVVYFLRKVIWMVPGFTVAAHRDRLRELDALIRAEGPFVAHSARFLIEARKP
ncbi:methyltransferase domain-containing protein [Kitasatospora sp. NBC_01300]|uniref:methyltransferase domain-containing protein n=1 Tax=Kitasatospora sp. NBC_01300 TaxID=2903574 RepID=UPI00352FEA27|nr:methyltransferase domain-containing protein [Kitasatospora sp. NBC_01300]